MSVEDLVFTKYFLDPPYPEEMPLILCTHSTKAEGSLAVRYRDGEDLLRPNAIPLLRFMDALKEFRDTRELGEDFLIVDGFERDKNRQHFVDTIKRPVVFVFDNKMLESAGYHVPGKVTFLESFDSGIRGKLQMAFNVPPNRYFHKIHLQLPLKLQLFRLGLIHSVR